jgi:hypothetical protein
VHILNSRRGSAGVCILRPKKKKVWSCWHFSSFELCFGLHFALRALRLMLDAFLNV